MTWTAERLGWLVLVLLLVPACGTADPDPRDAAEPPAAAAAAGDVSAGAELGIPPELLGGAPLEADGSGVLQAAWTSTAMQLRGEPDQEFRVRCPPNGQHGVVWGTDVYTDDSSICTAAVHAGRITARTGGVVTVRIRPGRAAYPASQRNGVSTESWGPWSGSFDFR